MSDEATRFRNRALDCRNMADASPNGEWRDALLDMAKDFEEEAARIEAEEASANDNS